MDLVLHNFLETSESKLLLQFVEDLGLHYLLLKSFEFRVRAAVGLRKLDDVGTYIRLDRKENGLDVGQRAEHFLEYDFA